MGKTQKPDIREDRQAPRRLQSLLEFLPDPVFAFTLDSRVDYINPAFERVFGWTLKEVRGKKIKFIPDHLLDEARKGMQDLLEHRSVHDFETQRYTRDGRILDILINGSTIFDEDDSPLGHVLILRDITAQKRIEQSRQIMFRISRALHSYRDLRALIAYINREIKLLVGVEGSFILLADQNRDQLFFYAARFREDASDSKFKTIRFPADQGVSGRAFTSGAPVLVPDVSKCDFYYQRVSDETDLVTRNMLSVPIKLKDRTIGVISVVNKSSGDFDGTDAELLATVGSTIALPIENARIHEELKKSHRELKALNHAKDKVINHLAHEMKTPVAVLGASMKLLEKKLTSMDIPGTEIQTVLERSQRNLGRILDIQYETEDLLKEKDYKAYHLLTRMADACRDEMEVLLDTFGKDKDPISRLRKVVDEFFGPRKTPARTIRLHHYLKDRIGHLGHQLRERKCRLTTELKETAPVVIPVEVLDMVVDGLIRNAVEYTPDPGRIKVLLQTRDNCPEMIVQDTGVGFTREKIHLIFENYFTPPESGDYGTKKPFAFNAGGNGFDLLRMQIFSERYNFRLRIDSRRCRVIPTDQDICPGDISRCKACQTPEDCFNSGGTSVHVRFMERVQ
ncbi:PAS domain S-box protein [Desulfospira joergensenii]|uniref:sensor histidine kinase n=1 Tax=Desulfospira joergensenii TaxID=53329 RepID=UPI0003B49E8E|nr:PAS domain S-box protein [Desulfospira joergensenii]